VLSTGVVGAAVVAGAPQAHAVGTYEVTRLTDDADPGSLRWAITQANGDAGSTITFAAGLTGTITLASDLPTVSANTVITGPGSAVLAINGADAYEQIHVTGSVDVSVSGLTLTNDDPGVDAAPALEVTGGATFVGTDLVVSNTQFNRSSSGPVHCANSTLTLTDSVITGNAKPIWAGAGGTLNNCATTIDRSVVSDNTSSGAPGLLVSAGTLHVTASTFSGNLGSTGGGAIFGYGATITVVDSTISGNTAPHSAALGTNFASFTLENSTVTGNTASGARGEIIVVGPGSTMALVQSTITGNTADETLYGVEAYGYLPSSLTTTGTILAGNAASTEVASSYGTMLWTSEASVLGTATLAITTDLGDNQTGVSDPGVATLADNGGPTQTMALLPDSPALDAGPATPPVFPGSEWDQRAEPFVRVSGGRIDVGAFEEQPTPAAVLTYAGATELSAGAGTVELAARVDPPECRSGALRFLVDDVLVATVPVDDATGLAAVTTAVPVGSTAFTVEVRLIDSVCAADPLRVRVAVAAAGDEPVPTFTG